ncbi:hypothetical protein CC78DRAFT_535871 [Lojkania enalia]|uniref:Fungal N-terminal domain-containing protein n=1 Tax=Lojkania enalia TaxID=147567 RepID=A0A9P4K7Y7_9PLEO|nr:hypothetical protein CC78DRAFT_535871 [Didymosphaeria enalia]
MTAIPSIGDILMLSQLALKIGRAFTAGCQGAPAAFLEVESEINGLAKALKLLAETLFTDSDGSLPQQTDDDTRHGAAIVLLSCQRSVKDLDALMDQYQVIKKHRTVGGFAIERSWSDLVLAQYETVSWTTGNGSIEDLRNMLRIYASTITLITQALQSKSSSRLEAILQPLADKFDSLYQNVENITKRLDEIHHTIVEIAGRTPPLPPARDPDRSTISSLQLDLQRQTSPKPESYLAHQYFPPRQPSTNSHTPPSPSLTVTTVPSSPSGTMTSTSTSPTSRKPILEFSVGGSSSRYSSSYASSEAGTSTWSPVAGSYRNSYLSRQSSNVNSTLVTTPEHREPNTRPESIILPPLPPPAIDILPDQGIENAMSISKLSIHPPTQPDIVKLHRSSTTSSQKGLFEREAFRNAAILCDVRCILVEYTQKVSPESDDVEMISACEDCRVAVVRKREPAQDNSVRIMTSIWTFSDDNTIRMELKLAEGELYVPYSSYFSPEKVSMTVPCELKFHDVKFGSRPLRTAKTHWINYVFDDPQGAILFQNEIMGRTLLGTYRTEKTLRIHEGVKGAFSYQEQMCGMENLRIWEDEETAAIIAMIHFSAHFRTGYLAFYLNSMNAPLRVKDEGGREIKIKGLRVPMEKGALRKDSGAGYAKDVDRRKIISGARVEFASEAEKKEFMCLVRNVQGDLRDLPDLLGVN